MKCHLALKAEWHFLFDKKSVVNSPHRCGIYAAKRTRIFCYDKISSKNKIIFLPDSREGEGYHSKAYRIMIDQLIL